MKNCQITQQQQQHQEYKAIEALLLHARLSVDRNKRCVQENPVILVNGFIRFQSDIIFLRSQDI